MPYEEGQPRLMGCLAWIPLKQVVQTKLFGGRYLSQYNFFTALSFQYESGAILGRARRDKLNILEPMLGRPSIDGELVKTCVDKAKERLAEFTGDVGKEPENFTEFNFVRELKRATGLTFPDCFTEAHISKNKKILEPLREKVPLEKAEPYMYIFGLEGIGFGSSFPELTWRMLRNYYEKKIDMNEWSQARAYGLDIPEKPDIVSLEERKESLLQIVAYYTAEYYPELLDPLDLRDYIDTEGNR